MLRKKVKKVELFNAINDQTEADLGFDEDTLPNKEWLVNVLKSLVPNHNFFQHQAAEIMREFPEEYASLFYFSFFHFFITIFVLYERGYLTILVVS